MNFLENSKNDAINNSKYYWHDSYFEYLVPLSLDERGKNGEDIVYRILKECGFDAYWDVDKNTNVEDGIYDVYILLSGKKIRIEVKTAMRGTHTESWQHENIYASNVWDKLVFVDIDHDKLYITVLDHSEIIWNKKHPILGKKPTLRKDNKNAYKIDMSKTSIRKGVDSGLTFCYTIGEDSSELIDFVGRKFAK